MATLKESGEAWIAAGQAEYGQMLVDAHDTIERQAKELADAEDGHKALEGEIRHRGKRFDLLRLERGALQENVDRLMPERDAALAEVAEAKGQIEWMDKQCARYAKEGDDARAEVERLKAELLEARRDCMGDLEKRFRWGML